MEKIIILIVGFGRLFDISFGANGNILIFSKYYKINSLFISLLVISAFCLNYYLIPKYGIEGAAYATVLSIVIFNVLKHLFVVSKFNLTPFTPSYFKLVAIALICFILNYYSPQIENPIIDGLIRTFSFACLFGILYVVLKVKTELLDQSLEKIKSFNFKKK